jgi:hypothetical protein
MNLNIVINWIIIINCNKIIKININSDINTKTALTRFNGLRIYGFL